MLPTITAFMAAHRLTEVTLVADAGMVSETNRNAIEDARLSYILGAKTPTIHYVVTEWQREHPGEQMPDGLILTQPWPATDKQKARGSARRGQEQGQRDGGRRAEPARRLCERRQ